jgi:hypothetical protein
LPAGCCGAGAGAGASAGFSGAGAGAGAWAGGVASGFGVSAGLQPTLNTANNINDNTNARTFFIKFSPPSRILKYAKKIVQHNSFVNIKKTKANNIIPLLSQKARYFLGHS